MNRIKEASKLLRVFAMFFALVGCGSSAGGQNDNSAEPPQDTNTQTEAETNQNSDTLVVYFSRTGEQFTVGTIDKGNTAIVAEMIAEHTGADTFEILPQEDYYPYTYDELTEVAKKEQNENAQKVERYEGGYSDDDQRSL
ncbi:MAG: hypothetical protein IJ109_07765 [Firmicutes bacterium]|nr:hypothetical protein [Bacillota bacterium]